MFRKSFAALAFAAVLSPAAALAVPTYTVEVVASGPGYLQAESLNDNGDVVGFHYSNEGTYSSMAWINGNSIDLGVDSPDGSYATSINNSGMVSGFYRDTTGNAHAYVWTGTLTDISHPDSSSSRSEKVNQHGQVLISTDSTENYIWQAGSGYTSLNTSVLSDTKVIARSINDAGQVVGDFKNADGDWQPFFRDSDGTFYEIPIIGSEEAENTYSAGSFTVDLNENGEVIGVVTDVTDGGELEDTAFQWTKEEGLTIFATGSYLYPASINNDGLITGEIYDEDYSYIAVLWENGIAYLLQDLISLDDPLFGNIGIFDAHGINENGQIAVSGYNFRTNVTEIYLLTPEQLATVPAPAALGLMIMGAGLMLSRRRRS